MSDATADRLTTALDDSALVSAARHVETTLSRWAGGSRLVGWLLADPDPDVIVVDLRETYTVGPLLRVLERGARAAEAVGLTDAAAWLSTRFAAEPLRASGLVLAALALVGVVSTVALGGNGTLGGWLLALGVGLLVSRERRSAEELGETRVGAALRAAFEPPEPPDRR
jgi:hypothetical protein